MGINLFEDLGYDSDSIEVKDAREVSSMYSSVIDALVECRESSGLKQKEVAKRMGTSQSSVSEFENVNADARFSTLIRYAQAVGCELVIEVSQPSEEWVTEGLKNTSDWSVGGTWKSNVYHHAGRQVSRVQKFEVLSRAAQA